MGRIQYLVGDATSPEGDGNKIIAHICNDAGGWGRGFVVAISDNWPEPEKAYREWHRNRAGNDFALGAVQVVQVEDDLWVANMIAQHGTRSGGQGQPPIRYESVETGLAALATEVKARNATVHMPRIGCGLAGGCWDAIEPIIERRLCNNGIEVFVYDLE
jgi:O-acetyl-ADP-ribose deacetylase (regulator of RNase III)